MSELKLKITSWGDVVLDKKELRAVMRSAANDVRSKTAKLINASSGGGRTYRGGGGGRYRGYKPGHYKASAPGEPPVRVTGTLRNSMRAYVYPSGEGFAVRQRAFYALFLEAGASGGGNPGRNHGSRRRRARNVYNSRVLAPRPSLDVVMAQQAASLEKRVTAALHQGLTWKQTKNL